MPFLPFTTTIEKKQFVLHPNSPLSFIHSPQTQLQSFIASGIDIGSSYFNQEEQLHGTKEAIIKQIHTFRYTQTNPYVITGGHFHQLYVRNLGIFFNALLDPRIPSSEEDWINRQAIVLKTVALDLETFRQAKRDFTTIVPLAKNRVTAMNIYTRPSDSLFGILYALRALTDPRFIIETFPAATKVKPIHMLQTQKAAKKLLATYSPSLCFLIKQYLDEIMDAQTGLVQTTISLASARDGIRRQSAFYDNVIAWSTCQLANKLGIKKISGKDLLQWKQRIITAFWDEEEQIFLDDLAQETKRQKLFSADAFIIYSTGFLNPDNPQEKKYFLGMIEYVKRHDMDSPFPLNYSTRNEPKKLHWPVKYFAPSYMGRSIWSHWGMEYIKILICLQKDDKNFLSDAKKHLTAYEKNIAKYGGYPELYNMSGKPLSNRLYKSVLHNGWVINYEQTAFLLYCAHE